MNFETVGTTWGLRPGQKIPAADLADALARLAVTAAPGLLTDFEAAMYLRLIESDDDAESARRRINRLVDRHKIRPCLVGGRRRYAKAELDRFIHDETARYGELPS